MQTVELLTQQAYEAYTAQAGGVTFDNKPLPTFDELGENRQQCWYAAIGYVLQATGSNIQATTELCAFKEGFYM